MSALDNYLRTLAASLQGRRHDIDDIIEEISGGLADLVEAHMNAGASQVEAEQRTLEEFGSVDEIAPELQEVLAASASRRTALGVALVMILQPLAWGLPFQLLTRGFDTTSQPGYEIVDQVVEWVGTATIVAMMLVWIATRWSMRHTTQGQRVNRIVGVVGLTSVSVVGMLGLILSITGPVDSGIPAPLVMSWAAAVLYLPLIAAGRASWHAVRASRPPITMLEDPAEALPPSHR